MANASATIVIKKINKAEHAHHGGAWKVAYADFMTAMMAFFLLLWLLNATTEEQKKGISDYFSPASVSKSASGAGAILAGQVIGPPGARTANSTPPSVTIELKPSWAETNTKGEDDAGQSDRGEKDREDIPPERLAEEIKKREGEMFAKAETELRQAIRDVPELRDLEKNLIVDKTPEGLRIQIVDQEGQPMFAAGSARPLERTHLLLQLISRVIDKLPNKISISGHTDSSPYRGGSKNYGNWELSADRAGASRRALIDSGLKVERIAMVVGRADKEPLIAEDVNNSRNRRISIVLLSEGGPLGALTGGAVGANGAASGANRGTPQRFERDWRGPRVR